MTMITVAIAKGSMLPDVRSMVLIMEAADADVEEELSPVPNSVIRRTPTAHQ